MATTKPVSIAMSGFQPLDWLPPTSSQVGSCLHLWLGEAAEGPSVLAHLQEKKDGSTGTVLQHLPQESARPRNPFTATFWGSFLARRLPWEGDRTDARVPAPETVVLPIGSKNIETLGWKITTGSINN